MCRNLDVKHAELTYRYTSEYRKGASNSNAEYFSRLPQPATSIDTNKACRLTYLDDVDVYFIIATGLWPRFMRDRPISISALHELTPHLASSLLDGFNDVMPIPPPTIDPTVFCLDGDPIKFDPT